MAEEITPQPLPVITEPTTTERRGPIKLTDWPPLIHAWHYILVSWICVVLVGTGVMSPEPASWLCNIFLIITMTIIMTDFRPVWFLVFIIALALVLAISKILALSGIGILSSFWSWVQALDPSFDATDHGIATAIITLLYLLMLGFQPFLNYWEVDHNEVRHVRGGRVDNTYTRQNYDFGSRYKDALEFLSTLSAEFVIKEKGSAHVVSQISSVPLFPFRRRRIDDVLRTLAVVTEPAKPSA
ncbi:MAG: hypothetical protein AB1486_02325 [Planctomycetota bacterium]